jgi:SAM-dependent methyltransferase
MLTSNLMIKGNRSNYEILLNDLDVRPYDKILEIGYGPGIGIKMIAEKCDSCVIHGIDFSKLMYKRASGLNNQYIKDNKVRLLLGDFLTLEVDFKDYDKVYCLNVIYFWNDLLHPFEKIRSILKKCGVLCFYMAHKDFLKKKKSPDEIFNKYSIEQVTEALTKAGFSRIHHYYNKGYYVKAEK